MLRKCLFILCVELMLGAVLPPVQAQIAGPVLPQLGVTPPGVTPRQFCAKTPDGKCWPFMTQNVDGSVAIATPAFGGDIACPAGNPAACVVNLIAGKTPAALATDPRSANMTYQAPFTGSVSLSQQAKNAQTINIDEAGAAGDGATDDTPALARAAAFFVNTSGGVVRLSCNKSYYMNSAINLAVNYPGVVVKGCLEAPDYTTQTTPNFTQNGRIIFGPSFRATIGNSTGFANVAMTEAGQTFPVQTPANFAGTPIATASGSSSLFAILHHVLVVGAATCFDGTNGTGRLDMDDFRCDGTNGVVLGPSLDTAVADRIHLWPWATATYSAGTPTNTRTGTGIYLPAGACDDTHINNPLVFGWLTGIGVSCNGNLNFGGKVWLDNDGGSCFTVVGSTNVMIDSLQAITCGSALQITTLARVQISKLIALSTTGPCVLLDGVLNISSMELESCSNYGVKMTSRSQFSTGFLRVKNLSGGVFCPDANFPTNSFYMGQFMSGDFPNSGNSLANGTQLFQCNNMVAPTVALASPLPIPPGANPTMFSISGSGTVTSFLGFWANREIIVTLASGQSIASSSSIVLQGGVSSISGPGTYRFKADVASVTWQME